MAEASKSLNIMVTGGADGAGLATVRALLKRGHKVVATGCDAEGALTVRMAGGLPAYPDLGRASEVLSTLRMAEVDAIAHAGPQYYGGAPQGSAVNANIADPLATHTAAVVEAAEAHAVKRFVSLSYGYLYETGQDAAVEGDSDTHETDYHPMLAAERSLQDSGLNGAVIRSGYIYGGHSPDTALLADAVKRSGRLPSGTRPASWIHEDDLAAAIVLLLETDAAATGVEIFNAADETPRSPNDFAAALAHAIGLTAPGFSDGGPFALLRGKTLRDKLLARDIVISSAKFKEICGWAPRHSSIESGLDATALVWRMRDAVNRDDYYNAYEDAAAEAIQNFAYAVALPQPVAEAAVASATETAASAPAPVAAATPPPADGPTPWNEDEAKREARRLKALERKAKRAAKQSGG